VARLRIGTCSWKYPSWEGLVYSRPSGIDYLSEYARRYRSVEVDQWFWTRLPSAPDVAAYRAAVDDGFRFTVKAPNALTLPQLPARRGGPAASAPRPNPDFLSPALLAEFLRELEPLAPVLGMIMLQFGYLNQAMLSGQAELLQRLERFLAEAPRGVPCAVEIRNPRWLNRRHFEFLREHGVHAVLVEGYWMDPVADTVRRAAGLIEGAVVIRLHGPDREAMEERSGGDWSRLVRPRDAELAEMAATVRRLLLAGVDVFLNVNNHYEGSAPLTIERLRALGIVDGEHC